MEAGGICPSMALALIAEGGEQVVAIDHKTMLLKIMQALGAKEMPVFKVIDCEDQGVRVSIKLDVSAAKYSVGQKITTALVEGDPNTSKLLAEKSAVLKAIKHLSDKHLIKVHDYSSRVATEIHGNSTFGDVNAALYSLEKIIGHWETNIGQCKQLAVTLEGKGCEQDGDAEVYQSLNDFAALDLMIYQDKVASARSTATDLEFSRKKYHNRSTERYHATLRKGYLQDAYLTQKQLLEYVLNYLGAGKAKYTNGPTDYGLMKAKVTFFMPLVQGIDYCGNLCFKGKAMRSMDAEEDAAFHALQFMEEKYRMTFVDLNHEDRIQCQEEQKVLVRILERTIDVALDVQKYWGKMVSAINREQLWRTESIDPNSFYSGTASKKKIQAYKFCATAISELASASNKAYDECASRFEEMVKIQHKLQDTKAMLNME